jgi:hypothetical protein
MKKKNKPFTVILVVVVGIVWVNVIIKVVDNLSAEQHAEDFFNSSSKNFMIPSLEERSFTLKVNYKDPFIRPLAIASHRVNSNGETQTTYVYDEEYIEAGYALPAETEVSSTKNNKNPHLAAASKPFVWPKITYHGIIRRSGNEDGLIVIKFNNELLKLRRGDEFHSDFKIEYVYRDSVLIRHQEDLKMFFR